MEKENILFLMMRSEYNINNFKPKDNTKEYHIESRMKTLIKNDKFLEQNKFILLELYHDYASKYPRKAFNYNILEYVISHSVKNNNGKLDDLDKKFIDIYMEGINERKVNKRKIQHLHELFSLLSDVERYVVEKNYYFRIIDYINEKTIYNDLIRGMDEEKTQLEIIEILNYIERFLAEYRKSQNKQLLLETQKYLSIIINVYNILDERKSWTNLYYNKMNDENTKKHVHVKIK